MRATVPVRAQGRQCPKDQTVRRLVRRRLQDRSFAEQPIDRPLRGGFLDVLAPGREIASDCALGALAVTGPPHTAVLQQEHLGGAAGERVVGDDGAGLFNRAATEQSETHVTKLTGVRLWIAW